MVIFIDRCPGCMVGFTTIKLLFFIKKYICYRLFQSLPQNVFSIHIKYSVPFTQNKTFLPLKTPNHCILLYEKVFFFLLSSSANPSAVFSFILQPFLHLFFQCFSDLDSSTLFYQPFHRQLARIEGAFFASLLFSGNLIEPTFFCLVGKWIILPQSEIFI